MADDAGDGGMSDRTARNRAKAERLLRNHGAEAFDICKEMLRTSRFLSGEYRHWWRVRRHLRRFAGRGS